MIDAGKIPNSCQSVFSEGESMQAECINIALQYFPRKWVEGSAGLKGQGQCIVLEDGVADGAAGIHDSRLALSTNIQVCWMIEPQRMSIFVSSGS